MPVLNQPAGSRPNAQGMSPDTYTGNVSFSRGTNDLIAQSANLPSAPAPTTPAPTQKPATPQKPTWPKLSGGSLMSYS